MRWHIQDKIFGEETDLFVSQVKKCTVSEHTPDSIIAGELLIVRGSIEFVELFGNQFGCGEDLTPTYLNLKNYDCSKYYPCVKDLLNKDHIFCTWNGLSNSKSNILDAFCSEKIFIRPNSGRKLFTGTTLTKKWWDKELDIIRNLPNSKIKEDDLVLVSSYKNILAEARILMHEKEVLGFSCYGDDKITDFVKIDKIYELVSKNNYFLIDSLKVYSIFNNLGQTEMDLNKILNKK
jgi:hypothetical protein